MKWFMEQTKEILHEVDGYKIGNWESGNVLLHENVHVIQNVHTFLLKYPYFILKYHADYYGFCQIGIKNKHPCTL
jgi:hypothetical protein